MTDGMHREGELYRRELPERIDAVFAARPEMFDHRNRYPWVLACLGDPFAEVWFVAENPSLGQVERALESTAEDQWNVSPGDKLFRQMLVKHGFKEGTVDSPGGWRCYITDVIKSVDRAEEWNRLPESERRKVAEAWAPVLAWELELGRPKLVVSLGLKADRLLNHLLARSLLPFLPERMKIHHYSYIASRADSQRRLGPGHPTRVAEWDAEFAEVAARRDGGPASQPVGTIADSRRGARPAKRPEPSPGADRREKSTAGPAGSDVPIVVIRHGLHAGLTPEQIYARNGRQRTVWLAAIEEEARLAGEHGTLEAAPHVVADLRDGRTLRWERIAVRVFGDPRKTTAVKQLYDEARGPGASKRSYTGRGRRFAEME